MGISAASSASLPADLGQTLTGDNACGSRVASSTIDSIVNYLRSKHNQGETEKAKAVVRAAARKGGFPGFGAITPDDAELAIARFLNSTSDLTTCTSSPSGNVPDVAMKECNAAPCGQSPTSQRSWVTVSDVAWRQAPRENSPLLGTLPAGRHLVELPNALRAPPGWVAVQPRGWVKLEGLTISDVPMRSVRSPELTPTVTMVAASKKRSLSPPAYAPAKVSRPRVETHPQAEHIFVLDALNILKHRNNEEYPRSLAWAQLLQAGRYYKRRGKRVFAFLRKTRQWSPQDMDVRELADEQGEEFIVRCPPGACDDEFMITFVKDLEKDSQGKSAFIVTNDLFRDHHKQVDEDWVKAHTVKYTFAGDMFVPQACT